jgi:hypothetical protein
MDCLLAMVASPEEKRCFGLSFPYVCPEPVLVKCSFLYVNGSKRSLLLTEERCIHDALIPTTISVACEAKENDDRVVSRFDDERG